jgi:hypothetical protein
MALKDYECMRREGGGEDEENFSCCGRMDGWDVNGDDGVRG